jgi:hypothetical protein
MYDKALSACRYPLLGHLTNGHIYFTDIHQPAAHPPRLANVNQIFQIRSDTGG